MEEAQASPQQRQRAWKATLLPLLASLEDRDGRTARERGVGLGLLISGAVIAHGAERGCMKAEILAINDDGAAALPCHLCSPLNPDSNPDSLSAQGPSCARVV